MAKLFYTSKEAASRLGKTEDELKELVRSGELREFRDGKSLNYKVEDVEAIAPAGGDEVLLEPAEDVHDSGIQLTPGSGSDVLSLDDVDTEDAAAGTKAAQKAKEASVISSVGVSVFDDDELEEAVDPLAQTHVGDVDALGIDGVGSGSGILDLTRERDDTSLGAELLEEIYTEDEGETAKMGDDTRAGLDDALSDTPTAGSEEIFEDQATAQAGPGAGASPGVRIPTRVYRADAMSAALTALMVVAVAVMLLAGLGAASLTRGVTPGVIEGVYRHLGYYTGGAAAVGAIATAVTFMLARRSG